MCRPGKNFPTFSNDQIVKFVTQLEVVHHGAVLQGHFSDATFYDLRAKHVPTAAGPFGPDLEYPSAAARCPLLLWHSLAFIRRPLAART